MYNQGQNDNEELKTKTGNVCTDQFNLKGLQEGKV